MAAVLLIGLLSFFKEDTAWASSTKNGTASRQHNVNNGSIVLMVLGSVS